MTWVPVVTVTEGPTFPATSVNAVDVVDAIVSACAASGVRAAPVFAPVDTRICPAAVNFAGAVSFKSPDKMLAWAAVNAFPLTKTGGVIQAKTGYPLPFIR